MFEVPKGCDNVQLGIKLQTFRSSTLKMEAAVVLKVVF
jgi:hypothetical protein